MPRKILVGHLCAAFVLAGCATTREKPTMPAPVPAAPAATPTPAEARPATVPKPRAIASPAPRKPPAPAVVSNRASLPAMIGAGAAWTSPGYQSLAVRSGDPAAQPPVSIFRQANTLAAVRAALADSPARPQAEFRNGVLTLKFDRGSNEEIASAVHRTLSVTGSRNLHVALQP